MANVRDSDDAFNRIYIYPKSRYEQLNMTRYVTVHTYGRGRQRLLARKPLGRVDTGYYKDLVRRGWGWAGFCTGLVFLLVLPTCNNASHLLQRQNISLLRQPIPLCDD